jgi:hypothetical protein
VVLSAARVLASIFFLGKENRSPHLNFATDNQHKNARKQNKYKKNIKQVFKQAINKAPLYIC